MHANLRATELSEYGVAAVETDWRRSSRFPLYIPAASERDALSFFRSHSAHNSNPSEGPLCPRGGSLSLSLASHPSGGRGWVGSWHVTCEACRRRTVNTTENNSLHGVCNV